MENAEHKEGLSRGYYHSRLTENLPSGEYVHLRIIAVNDLYELSNMPRFKTCVDLYRTPNTIVTVAGDFVAPSSQAAIDKGRAMVDVMNRCEVDYVCLGNHETNISWDDLKSRARESKFTWINTNMPDVVLPDDVRPWPSHVIREFQGTHGKIVKVALLGLNTNNPNYYAGRTVFGGAPILPVNQTAKEWAEKLKGQVDSVIPLTHQKNHEDKELGKLGLNFPCIIGGHDHFLWHEVVHGQHLVKFGQNAEIFGIIDIIWIGDDPQPSVGVRVLDAKLFKPDEAVAKCIYDHECTVRLLSKAILFPIGQGVKLSSKNVRQKATTMATLLCTALKKAHQAEACLLGSGFNRAEVDYEGRHFHYSDLINELPMEIVVSPIWVPGSVLAATIAYSRTGDRWGTGAFMQTDGGMEFDGIQLVKINGEPFDPNRKYFTVMQHAHVSGCDNLVPLMEWVKANESSITLHDEFYISAQVTLVEYFSKVILLQYAKFPGSKQSMTRDELEAHIKKLYGDDRIVGIMVDNIMALGKNGVIERNDFLSTVFELTGFEEMDTNKDGFISLEEATKYLQNELNATEEETKKIFTEIDTNSDGLLSKEEFRSFVASRQCKSIKKFSLVAKGDAKLLIC